MVGNILRHVTTAGILHSSATAVPRSLSTFRRGVTLIPSPSSRVMAWNNRVDAGVLNHNVCEPIRPRIELDQQYSRIGVYSAALLCSLLLLRSYIYSFLNISNSNKKKRLPPGPTALPVLGSLLTVGTKPHESLAKLAKSHGPLMTVKFGMVDVVIVSSAETAREVLQRNDRALSGRPTPEAVVAAKNYEMSMVWSSGLSPHWKKLRRICNCQLFTSKRLDELQGLRNRMMKDMVEEVDRAREAREALYVGRLVFGTSLNFLSNTMFSSDMFDAKSDELKELISNLIEVVGTPNVADYVPFLKLFDPQGIRRRLTLLYERLGEVLDDIIERRIEHRACGVDIYGDFLDVLLDHTEENGYQELTCQNINVLLMDLFLGGTHTTTTVLEWAMAELLHNPTILIKAKNELSAKISPRKLILEQDIPQLPYLEATIKEALRLHPIAPLLVPHQANEQVKLNGYTIPEHTQVFVNAWTIMRDPTYWDNPSSFMPERFLNSDIDFRGRDFEYIPFGAGRRICPGSNLAMRMVSLMLANLLHNFDWELPDGLKPEEMSMEEGLGMTLHKHEPLVVIPLSTD